MKTGSTAVAGRDGEYRNFANRIIHGAVRRSLASLTLCWLCVGGVAAAENTFSPADLAGRWFSKERDLTLDIAQCGPAWCGVQVTNGTSCGATVLHLNLEAKETWFGFTGRLELASLVQPYAVHASLYRLADGAPGLRMHGNTGNEVELFRRTFPFSAVFVRAGEAACPPGTKTS
jgi:hypothetical protein